MLSSQSFSTSNDEYQSIMKPYFKSDKFLLFKYYSPRYEGILFRGSIYQKVHAGSTSTTNGGSFALSYERGILQVKKRVKTTGEIDLGFNIDLNKYAQNLQSKIKFRTNYLEKGYSGKIGLLWLQDRFSIKSNLDLGSHKSISSKILGLLLNEPGQQLGLGMGLSFSFEDKQFAVYNTTLWYTRNYAKLVFIHKTKKNKFGLGRLIGRIYNKVDDKTDVALGFVHSFGTARKDLITLGLRHKHSDAFTIKTKIDSTLNMKAAFELALDKNLNLVIASNHNVGDPSESMHKSLQFDNTPPISIRISYGEL